MEDFSLPMTDEQKASIKRLGLRPINDLTIGRAARRINEEYNRRRYAEVEAREAAKTDPMMTKDS